MGDGMTMAADTAAPTPASGRFSIRTVLVLILVGVFSLSALAVLSAYAPDLRNGDDGEAHALSRSAVGYAGTVQFLRNAGEQVVLSRGPLHGDAEEGLLILTPNPGHDAEALKAVRHSGTTLVVLPKWGVAPLPANPAWVRAAGMYHPSMVAAPLAEKGKPGGVVRRRGGDPAAPVLTRPNGYPVGSGLAPVLGLQTLSGDDWIPVVVDQSGGAVLAMNRKSGVYVLSDPDLLNTHGLSDPDNAVAAMRMIKTIWPNRGPVIFDLTLPGFSRPRSLLRLILEPPLLGATLALLAAAALVGYQAMVRFGPSHRQGRAIALGKRALADNSAGLIRLAGREHHMAGPYALLVRAAVARAVGAPRNLSGEELDAFLDRLGKTVGAGSAYTALAAEARAARTAGDLLRVARNLYRWRLEMTRGRQ